MYKGERFHRLKPSVRMSHIRQCRGERTRVRFKMHVELFEKAPHRGALEKNQFGFPDHHLLMTIPDMVRIVGPFLRRMRLDDVDGFRSLDNLNDCPLRFERQAIAALENGPARKRYRELNPGI